MLIHPFGYGASLGANTYHYDLFHMVSFLMDPEFMTLLPISWEGGFKVSRVRGFEGG